MFLTGPQHGDILMQFWSADTDMAAKRSTLLGALSAQELHGNHKHHRCTPEVAQAQVLYIHDKSRIRASIYISEQQ